jgi:hypothetical protein
MFRRKSRWAKLLGGLVVLKAIPKKPIAGMAALLGGGYMVYRKFMRNSGEHGHQHMQAA